MGRTKGGIRVKDGKAFTLMRYNNDTEELSVLTGDCREYPVAKIHLDPPFRSTEPNFCLTPDIKTWYNSINKKDKTRKRSTDV